jgi:hypothetical protein
MEEVHHHQHRLHVREDDSQETHAEHRFNLKTIQTGTITATPAVARLVPYPVGYTHLCKIFKKKTLGTQGDLQDCLITANEMTTTPLTPSTPAPTATSNVPAPTRAANHKPGFNPNPPTAPNPPYRTRAANQNQTLESKPNPPTLPNPHNLTFHTFTRQSRSTNHKPERGIGLNNPPNHIPNQKQEPNLPTAPNPTQAANQQSSAKPNLDLNLFSIYVLSVTSKTICWERTYCILHST